jgi:hypothetical protein
VFPWKDNGKTREECERLLANLIQRMKAEIAIEKERLRQEEKAGQKAAGARTPKACFSVCG